MKSFFLLVFVGIFLFESSNYSNCLTNELNEIIPLKVGNHWKYRFTKTDLSDKVLVDSLRNFFVSSSTIVNDESWYLVDSTNPYYSTYLNNRPDGLYSWSIGEEKEPNLWLKYPISVGEKFGEGFLGHDADSSGMIQLYYDFWMLAEKNVSVSVPAGTFNCYKYQRRIRTGKNKEYPLNWFIFISPGIGLIKEERLPTPSAPYSVRRDKQRTELVSYKLN